MIETFEEFNVSPTTVIIEAWADFRERNQNRIHTFETATLTAAVTGGVWLELSLWDGMPRTIQVKRSESIYGTDVPLAVTDTYDLREHEGTVSSYAVKNNGSRKPFYDYQTPISRSDGLFLAGCIRDMRSFSPSSAKLVAPESQNPKQERKRDWAMRFLKFLGGGALYGPYAATKIPD